MLLPLPTGTIWRSIRALIAALPTGVPCLVNVASMSPRTIRSSPLRASALIIGGTVMWICAASNTPTSLGTVRLSAPSAWSSANISLSRSSARPIWKP